MNKSCILDQIKFLPESTDYDVHWLETRQGRLDAKTGIPPTLYTLTAKHFLSNKGRYFHIEQCRVQF